MAQARATSATGPTSCASCWERAGPATAPQPGQVGGRGRRDRLLVMECELDDLNPQVYGVLMASLFDAARGTCSTRRCR